jgi:acyl dehydratase
MSAAPLAFESLAPGQVLGTLDKGVISTAHIMRWSAAVENFHRIHYDLAFATGHDKLPGLLINGSWKQHVLVQLAKDSVGPAGWLWRLKFRYKKMDLAGDALHAVARVVDKRAMDGLGFVTLAIELLNQAGEVSTAGHAICVMPSRPGASVPYPFEPQPAHREISFPHDD